MAFLGPNRPLAALLLATCFGLGFYGTMITSFNNGYFKFLGDAKLVEPLVIPGCPAPLKTEYTGIGPVDYFLTSISFFFCTFLDGEVAWPLRMSGWYLMVQFSAGWALLSVEGLRLGNDGKAVGRTGMMGLIVQHLSYTFTVPLYLILHLFTSPISQPTTRPASSLILASSKELAFLPIAMLFALFIPTFLIGLQGPEQVSVTTRYNLIAVWQFFPLWQSILQFLYKLNQKQGDLKNPARGQTLSSLRRVYGLVLGLVVAVHIAVLAVALTPASAVPDSWTPFFSEVTVSSVFLPSWITNPPTVEQTMAAGLSSPLAPLSVYFIQYDVNCGNLALVVWAAYLNRAALPSASVLALVLKALVWFGLGGPAAVATVLLWERDEAVLDASSEKKLK